MTARFDYQKTYQNLSCCDPKQRKREVIQILEHLRFDPTESSPSTTTK